MSLRQDDEEQEALPGLLDEEEDHEAKPRPVRNRVRSSRPVVDPKKGKGKGSVSSNGHGTQVPAVISPVKSSTSSDLTTFFGFSIVALIIGGVVFLIYEGRVEVSFTNSAVAAIGTILGLFIFYQGWFTKQTRGSAWVKIIYPNRVSTGRLVRIGVDGDMQRFLIDGKTYFIFGEYVIHTEYGKWLPKLFHAKVPEFEYWYDDPYPIWKHQEEPPLVSATELTDLLDPREGHILAAATRKYQTPADEGKLNTRVVMLAGFCGTAVLLIANLYFSMQIKDIVTSILGLAGVTK